MRAYKSVSDCVLPRTHQLGSLQLLTSNVNTQPRLSYIDASASRSSRLLQTHTTRATRATELLTSAVMDEAHIISVIQIVVCFAMVSPAFDTSSEPHAKPLPDATGVLLRHPDEAALPETISRSVLGAVYRRIWRIPLNPRRYAQVNNRSPREVRAGVSRRPEQATVQVDQGSSW